MADIFDAFTLSLRFSIEIAKAIIRFPLMNHEHRKEIVKALMSDTARGQFKAGELSKANSRFKKTSSAEKLKIRG